MDHLVDPSVYRERSPRYKKLLEKHRRKEKSCGFLASPLQSARGSVPNTARGSKYSGNHSARGSAPNSARGAAPALASPRGSLGGALQGALSAALGLAGIEEADDEPRETPREEGDYNSASGGGPGHKKHKKHKKHRKSRHHDDDGNGRNGGNATGGNDKKYNLNDSPQFQSNVLGKSHDGNHNGSHNNEFGANHHKLAGRQQLPSSRQRHTGDRGCLGVEICPADDNEIDVGRKILVEDF
jgi:hypothetical protein